MILSHTVLVGNKLYTWKSSLIHEQTNPFPKAFAALGSLSSRYFPSLSCQEPVILHTALFNTWEEYNGWISSLPLHPSKPETFPVPSNYPFAKPVCYAEFEVTMQGDDTVQYWWVKDNIQNKEWIINK